MSTVNRALPVPIEKWAELLGKAQAQGVILAPAPRSTVIKLATRPGSADRYVVGPDTCNCPAGSRGVFCKHRAVWMFEHMSEYAEAVVLAMLKQDEEALNHAVDSA